MAFSDSSKRLENQLFLILCKLIRKGFEFPPDVKLQG